MKFTVSSQELQDHLQNISKVINNKNTLPILDSFLFKVHGDDLEITASDMDTTLITRMKVADVDDEGDIAISAARLLNLLKEMPEEPMTFDINKDNLHIDILTQNGKFDFNGESAESYPEPKAIEEGQNELLIPAKDLLQNLRGVLFALGNDDSRVYMECAMVDIFTDKIIFVGTDAKKLVKIENKNLYADKECQMLLQHKPAQMLCDILAKVEEDVEVSFDDRTIRFKMNDYTVISRQIEAKFPNYQSIIPTENNNEVLWDRDGLLRAVKRMLIFANKDNNLLKITLRNNNAKLEAWDTGLSHKAEENFACSYDSDNEVVLGIDAKIMSELLPNIKTSEVKLNFKDEATPYIFYPVDDKEAEDSGRLVTMVVMPIQIFD